MVHKRANESEMQGEADEDRKFGNKFLYQNKKQQANPWSSFECSNDSKYSTSTDNGKHMLNSTYSKFAPPSSTSKFDLDSVWSVRKNVPLSNTKQASQLNSQTGNSFYSRHTRSIVGLHQGKTDQTPSNNAESGNSTWQMKKPGYSYTNQGSLKRQADADDDDEFDFGETKKRSFQSPSLGIDKSIRQSNSHTSKGSLSNLINPVRKGSARTQRAQKMNEAYLKSAGLGFYAPTGRLRENSEDDIN